MSRLVLVKHASPDIRPGIAPHEWHLSARGREGCRKLADVLTNFDMQLICTSHEPKASETAQIIAKKLSVAYHEVDDLHEHVRTIDPDFNQKTFEAHVAAFFAQPAELIFGSETADQAYERFSRAINLILQNHPGQNIAVVSHGTVISLYVSRVCSLDPFLIWKALTLPSYIVLDTSVYPQLSWISMGK